MSTNHPALAAQWRGLERLFRAASGRSGTPDRTAGVDPLEPFPAHARGWSGRPGSGHFPGASINTDKQLAELQARLASDPEWHGGRYYGKAACKTVLTYIRVETR